MSASSALSWLFAATLLLSAWLLMAIQPAASKSVLPWLGGSSSVWNTCMVFFQLGVLAGYAYAHLAIRALGVRRHAIVHVTLLAASFALLPIHLRPSSAPAADANPIPWLLWLLAGRIGLPFFLVAGSAPLLQRWFGASRHGRAADPYFLYAVSNAGSLIGLLSYPTLIEPVLTLQQQLWAWSVGYGLLAALAAACAVSLLRTPSPFAAASVESLPDASPLTWTRRLQWLLLAAIPSSLMLGATTYLTTDIAAIPLLWVIPLSVYLLTYILAFGSSDRTLPRWLRIAQPIVLVPLAVAMITHVPRPAWQVVTLHVAALFLAALSAHRLLAADRPSVSRLTEYYLWIGLGGALGGMFNALVAPMVFPMVVEYPLMLVAASLLWLKSERTKLLPIDLLLPAALAGLLVIKWFAPGEFASYRWLIVAVPGLLAIAALASILRPVLFAAILSLLFVSEHLGSTSRPIHAARSFYGVCRVLNNQAEEPYHVFAHGQTIHGAQRMDTNDCSAQRLTYFNPDSPISDVLRLVNRRAPNGRVAVVGLGIGTLATYSLPTQEWTFYELDPLVERIATDARWFTVLRTCAPQAVVQLGDARLRLAEPGPAQDVLILDAFSSDSIPMHLLTREAMEVYLRRLAPDGLLAFQITNRYVRLEPPLANLAEASGLVAITRRLEVPKQERSLRRLPTYWVVMARESRHLDELLANGWRRLEPNADVPIWRDDFSNLLQVIRWR